MADFGQRLRELREAAGLTQQELALRIGVSSTYVSALESGRKPAPPRALVSALSSAMHVAERDLWSTARAEREERLSRRVDGVPASLRVSLDAGAAGSEGVGTIGGEGDSEGRCEATACDREMQKLITDIRKHFPDAERRGRLLRAIRALIETMKE